VDADHLSREDVVVYDFAQQRVPEREAAAGVVDREHVMLDGLAERELEFGVVDTRHFGQQAVIDAAPSRGGDADDVLRFFG
jgi:hypothetical protein